MKVLILDDDPQLRARWQDAFEHAGHHAVGAASVACACDKLHLEKFDLLVLELFVGSDNGLSVTTLAGYANPEARVIVVTGVPIFAEGELFTLVPNMSSVLRKPVEIDELLAVAEHCVTTSRAPELSEAAAEPVEQIAV